MSVGEEIKKIYPYLKYVSWLVKMNHISPEKSADYQMADSFDLYS